VKRPRSCGEGEPSLRTEAVASAKKLFLQWGYSGASIAMIAEILGVTKAALYYHFPDKEALFLAVFDDYLSCVGAELDEALPLFERAKEVSGDDARLAFSSLARIFLSRGAESVRMNELAFQEAPALSERGRAELGERYHRDLVRPLGACFRSAEETGWLRPARAGEPPRVWLFMGTLSAFFSPGHDGAEGKAALDLDESSEAFASFLLEGLVSTRR
jgi:AcrR family transcriptional regulator